MAPGNSILLSATRARSFCDFSAGKKKKCVCSLLLKEKFCNVLAPPFLRWWKRHSIPPTIRVSIIQRSYKMFSEEYRHNFSRENNNDGKTRYSFLSRFCLFRLMRISVGFTFCHLWCFSTPLFYTAHAYDFYFSSRRTRRRSNSVFSCYLLVDWCFLKADTSSSGIFMQLGREKKVIFRELFFETDFLTGTVRRVSDAQPLWRWLGSSEDYLKNRQGLIKWLSHP